MEMIRFTQDMNKTRQVIRSVTIFLAVVGIAGALLFLLGGREFYLAIEILTALGLVVFLLSLVFLILSYFRRPEVIEKRRLGKRQDQLEADLSASETGLAGALAESQAVRTRFLEQQAARKQSFDQLAAEIEQKIKHLTECCKDELDAQLAKLQQLHLDSGLKATPLDPLQVPGIGDVLLEKLRESGVQTALDVTREIIQGIPGFGESKILSLLRWRESVERGLTDTRPQALQAEQQAAIEQNFADQISALQASQEANRVEYQQAVDKIRNQETSDLAAAAARETSLREKLGSLQSQKQDTLQELQRYTHITWLRMLQAALNPQPANWARKILSVVVMLIFLAAGLLNVVILIATLITR